MTNRIWPAVDQCSTPVIPGTDPWSASINICGVFFFFDSCLIYCDAMLATSPLVSFPPSFIAGPLINEALPFVFAVAFRGRCSCSSASFSFTSSDVTTPVFMSSFITSVNLLWGLTLYSTRLAVPSTASLFQIY